MALFLFVLYLVFTLVTLYHGMRSIIWEVGSLVYLIVATFVVGLSWPAFALLVLFIGCTLAVLRLGFVRERLAAFSYKHAAKSVPTLTATEEEALNAGDTWLEEDIFRGAPNWKRLSEVSSELSKEEQAFLDNEVEELCAMLEEWRIVEEYDLPKPVWSFMKDKGFFGLVIPKEYEGKGFSARAHSDVVMKIASRSAVAAVTCMVPNSLGPGELLNYYGTEAQKANYLPKLAKGIEIPCFALTEPEAGSDATGLQSMAKVCIQKVDGKEVLGLFIKKLNKRWITLAPVATLIGLAVNLQDPDGLLKGEGQEGITCLLIPRATQNLEIGNRHLPAHQPFMNGSIRGKDIFVPIDCIIGGQQNAGRGWHMLVECLSIGRSISLPALAASTSSLAYMVTGAFARIRRQFRVEIGHFEGVQEKLAEIAGLNYLVNATRLLTVAAVNQHKKPSVASAITKYWNTELARRVINNAMDVHAGRAVVVGPRNYMSGMYVGIPISVTVEGANIMSRNLLIFGQGSMACHPYIRSEFYALANSDYQAFKDVFWKHVHYFFQNVAKALSSALTFGIFIRTPKTRLRWAYKRVARLSHAFAFLADASLLILGGGLKRKERVSARLGDGLSYLYLAMAILRYCKMNEETPEDKLHAKWALSYCFYNAEQALLSLCRNFPSRISGMLMRLIAFPLGKTSRYPSDALESRLAGVMMENNPYRDRFKKHLYLSGDPQQAVDRVENALQLLIKHADLYKKLKDLKKISYENLPESLDALVAKGELTVTEKEQILEVERARWDAIQVDEFPFDALKGKVIMPVEMN